MSGRKAIGPCFFFKKYIYIFRLSYTYPSYLEPVVCRQYKAVEESRKQPNFRIFNLSMFHRVFVCSSQNSSRKNQLVGMIDGQIDRHVDR